jgi:sugar lactone lactonase YvrE
MRKLICALSAFFLALWPLAITRASPALTTVATFNPALGELPENLVIDHRGNIYVNMAATGEIRKIAPDGTPSTLARFTVGTGNLLGLALDRQDNIYAAVASHDSPGSDAHGIWRVHPDGTKALFAALDPNGLPNQPTFEAGGDLLVSDSSLGVIWRITPAGTVSRWLSDALLRGDIAPCPGFPLPIGVNGMAFDEHRDLFAANTIRGLIVRILVNPDGSAGLPSAYAQSCSRLLGADGIALDNRDNLYIATNILSAVVRLSPDGTISTLATAADGLDNPSGVAFGTGRGERTDVFITNFALFTLLGGGTPHPSLMRMEVGVPGTPLH